LSRILVVYYSRSGITRRIARRIAKGCDADIEEIADLADRTGLSGRLRSAVEALVGMNTAIRPVSHPPADHDLVVVGTPVWCWNIASPVRSYLEAYRTSLHRVAFFCTFGGSGQDKVLGDLQRLCGKPAVATLALTDAQCAKSAHRAKLSEFVRNLLHGLRHGEVEAPRSRAAASATRTGPAR
jgi:flavodoxin